MDLLTLFFTAVGLSMDAFAVSVSDGMALSRRAKMREAVTIALTFGIFQAIMPIIGYLLGTSFRELVSSIDHWIAFGLLGIIGANMIIGAIKEKRAGKSGKVGSEEAQRKVFSVPNILFQGVATSIDALAVGISFAMVKVSIPMAAGLIGATTFVLCVAGVYLGKKAGAFLKTKAEVIGGSILIIIGIKTLVEHLIGM